MLIISLFFWLLKYKRVGVISSRIELNKHEHDDSNAL